MRRKITAGVGILCMLALTACGKTTEVSEMTQESTVEETTVTEVTTETETEGIQIMITSESINGDGRWLTVCSKDGGNVSPELSWAAIPDAAEYAVYMYDRTAGNWLHWKAAGITETHLEAGQFADREAGYVGPYPPSGSGDHEYEVMVYALKQAPDAVGGTLDNTCNVEAVETKLDTAGGAEGNILAQFSVTGLYATGDNNQ